jgi:hypothetical protein
LIDYSLNFENNENNDINVLCVELRQLNNLLINLSDENSDVAVKYLSERILKTADINSNLQAELNNIESSIRTYNVEFEETTEFQRVSLNSIDDDDIIDDESDYASEDDDTGTL